jgi:hypothetical protein
LMNEGFMDDRWMNIESMMGERWMGGESSMD